MRLLLRRSSSRDNYPVSLTQMAKMLETFQYQGQSYAGFPPTSLEARTENIGDGFFDYCQQAYKDNGIVFACALARMLTFSEARFQWRQFSGGRPQDLFGAPSLAMLEQPWANGTTGDLLARMEQDITTAGNFYAVRRPGPRLQRLRPDLVDILVAGPGGNPNALDAEVLGYLYWADGRGPGKRATPLDVGAVCHYAPIPDPEACYRGMSWLTPVIREIMSDKAMTNYKQRFLDKGATPAMAMRLQISDQDKFNRWVKQYREEYEQGVSTAFKTLFLPAGADPVPVGSTMEQIDFKAVQGAGETRICMAAGTPPVLVGSSEGLSSATYSNYEQAQRRFADITMRPLWRMAAAALEPIMLDVPAGAHLWYDDRDIPFLREDAKKAADITFVQAQAIRQLTDAGFDADSAVKGVIANDLAGVNHSGLFSVQLQPPGTIAPPAEPAANGAGNPDNLPAPTK